MASPRTLVDWKDVDDNLSDVPDANFHAIQHRGRRRRVAPPVPLRLKAGRVIRAAAILHMDEYRTIASAPQRGDSAA